jgi:hypothetical protein
MTTVARPGANEMLMSLPTGDGKAWLGAVMLGLGLVGCRPEPVSDAAKADDSQELAIPFSRATAANGHWFFRDARNDEWCVTSNEARFKKALSERDVDQTGIVTRTETGAITTVLYQYAESGDWTSRDDYRYVDRNLVSVDRDVRSASISLRWVQVFRITPSGLKLASEQFYDLETGTVERRPGADMPEVPFYANRAGQLRVFSDDMINMGNGAEEPRCKKITQLNFDE